MFLGEAFGNAELADRGTDEWILHRVGPGLFARATSVGAKLGECRRQVAVKLAIRPLALEPPQYTDEPSY
jgi:hypothetical protein